MSTTFKANSVESKYTPCALKQPETLSPDIVLAFTLPFFSTVSQVSEMTILPCNTLHLNREEYFHFLKKTKNKN